MHEAWSWVVLVTPLKEAGDISQVVGACLTHTSPRFNPSTAKKKMKRVCRGKPS